MVPATWVSAANAQFLRLRNAFHNRRNWPFHDTEAGREGLRQPLWPHRDLQGGRARTLSLPVPDLHRSPHSPDRRRPRGLITARLGRRSHAAPLYAPSLTSSPRPGAPTPGAGVRPYRILTVKELLSTPVGPSTRSTYPWPTRYKRDARWGRAWLMERIQLKQALPGFDRLFHL